MVSDIHERMQSVCSHSKARGNKIQLPPAVNRSRNGSDLNTTPDPSICYHIKRNKVQINQDFIKVKKGDKGINFTAKIISPSSTPCE